MNQSPSSISTMVKASPLRRLRPHPIPLRPRQTPTPLHFRNSIFLNPSLDRPNIAAFVPCIEIRKRVGRLLDPVVRNDAYVGVAHDVLPEHFDAVFCGRKESGQQPHARGREERGRVEKGRAGYQSVALSSTAGRETLRVCALLACNSPCGRPCGGG